MFFLPSRLRYTYRLTTTQVRSQLITQRETRPDKETSIDCFVGYTHGGIAGITFPQPARPWLSHTNVGNVAQDQSPFASSLRDPEGQ